MDHNKPAVVYGTHSPERGTLGLYISGFVTSIVCTFAAYVLVDIHIAARHETFTHLFLITVVALLALVQFFAQLFFFLHLGHETKPRWKLGVLAFMVLIVLILVFGSLWIMYNLNYRMTPRQMNEYMLRQDGGL